MSAPPTYKWDDSVPSEIRTKWTEAVARNHFYLNAARIVFNLSYDEGPPRGEDAFDVGFDLEHLTPEIVETWIVLHPLEDARWPDEVAHTIGHVFLDGYFFIRGAHRDRAAGWFTRQGQRGTAANWDGPYADSIHEATAEFFKDVYLSPRKNNNRTNWEFDKAQFNDFLLLINGVLCPPTAG